jgi:hypothetical protein
MRPWSLEGDAATPWLLTMLLEPPSTKSGMSAQLYAVVQCAQQALPRRLGTCGMEETASSSTKKSVEVSVRCSTICTIMLSEKTSENLMPRPLPSASNVGEGILRPGGGMHPP